VRTGDPAEKSDQDVLAVFIELDGASENLVVDLRVTVQFLDPTVETTGTHFSTTRFSASSF